jgi:hypothetical protein
MNTSLIGSIEELKQQLNLLGYYPFQVNGLIRETVHTNRLEKLSPEELNRLRKKLESHIEFARKCFNN